MPRTSPQPKVATFNIRIDPQLKAAFTAATEAEHRPAADVLRDLMRLYVRRRERRSFEAEARRQSALIAERARDSLGDEHASLRELEALFEEDAFKDGWRA
jgi:hypothetical protein